MAVSFPGSPTMKHLKGNLTNGEGKKVVNFCRSTVVDTPCPEVVRDLTDAELEPGGSKIFTCVKDKKY